MKNAGASIVAYERWRETGEAQLLRDIEAYNRDDVDSTRQLRDWLLTLRPAQTPWKSAATSRDVAEDALAAPTRAQQAERRLVPYRERLVDALPADTAQWTIAHRVSELTWQLLDFHRRAAKPAWWAMYERMDKDEDELLEDPECLARLELDPAHPPEKVNRSTRYTYVVPEQETKLKHGDPCTRADTGQALGELDFDEAARRVRLKVGPHKEPLPPRLSLGPGPRSARTRWSRRCTASPTAGSPATAATPRSRACCGASRRACRGAPRAQPIVAPGADLLDGCLAAVEALDASHLYVQGPPGAGKTHTGSHMIVHLLARGRRVGITSNSHKAIDHLLAGVMRLAEASGLPIRAVKKATGATARHRVRRARRRAERDRNGDVRPVRRAARRRHGLAVRRRGTPTGSSTSCSSTRPGRSRSPTSSRPARRRATWCCSATRCSSRSRCRACIPAAPATRRSTTCSTARRPSRPSAASSSARRWRMHPDVCRFISEAVYDGRLEPEPHNARQALVLGAGAHRCCGRPARACAGRARRLRAAQRGRGAAVARSTRARCGQRYVGSRRRSSTP